MTGGHKYTRKRKSDELKRRRLSKNTPSFIVTFRGQICGGLIVVMRKTNKRTARATTDKGNNSSIRIHRKTMGFPDDLSQLQDANVFILDSAATINRIGDRKGMIDLKKAIRRP